MSKHTITLKPSMMLKVMGIPVGVVLRMMCVCVFKDAVDKIQHT